jgi:hypothetical protein
MLRIGLNYPWHGQLPKEKPKAVCEHYTSSTHGLYACTLLHGTYAWHKVHTDPGLM